MSEAESSDSPGETDGRFGRWWQDAVVYQVYVRSFQDSDGDGLGDLDGITSRLDHLVWLGVDALWLTPFYPSPLRDGGYDIADFRAVDPRFGDLAAFDRLVAEAHTRGLRVILDFVPSHTSDRHPWFEDSRASHESPRRDWYVWRDGRDGGPPNGWRSMLDAPAWTRDPATGQWYYHAFLPKQPDLNWRNPSVVAAMDDVLRFWLERGVDGFRIDAVAHIVEDDLLREDPPPELDAEGLPPQAGSRHAFTSDRPETHARVAAWRRLVDAYPDRVLIGEVHLPAALVARYHGVEAPGFHLPFNFLLLTTSWDARSLAASIDHYLNLLPAGAWPNWVVGNHDEPRVASRLGAARARIAALLALTLGGTPFVYNGDELGLEDATPAPDAAPRPDASAERDPQRTPMPWDGTRHAGFTAGEPWLPLGSANLARHVAAQAADPGSTLTFYRRLIALRRAEPTLVRGAYAPLPGSSAVLAYTRELAGVRFAVVVNVSPEPASVALPGLGAVVLSTSLDREGEPCGGVLSLRPHEGAVIRLR